jgi:GDP-L-fucose synthase
MYPHKNTPIYIAGHRGMVGSALVRHFIESGYENLILIGSSELDLTEQSVVRKFFDEQKPEVVILAAAKVGGIQANIDNSATFLVDNLKIQNNVMESSLKHGVKKFVFMGSSCIYPKDCPQPMKEEYLLTGKLEPTNEGYALAKIAGIKLLEGYRRQYGFHSISLMPCNLYGPNDSFDLKHSHVLSALVKRFVDAADTGTEEITLWGTGNARREFLHVDDLARATVFMMNNYDDPQFINIGSGTDVSIRELAEMIASMTGFSGTIKWDHSKPDGMMKKCMDVSRMHALGFSPTISLETGVKQMISIYKKIKTAS